MREIVSTYCEEVKQFRVNTPGFGYNMVIHTQLHTSVRRFLDNTVNRGG